MNASSTGLAMTAPSDRSFRALLWVLAFLGFGLDQASKYTIFAWLRDENGGRHHFLWQPSPNHGFRLVADFQRDPDTRALQRYPDGSLIPHVNHGALFGFLREHQSLANQLFALISLLAALAIAYWSMQAGTARDPALCAALGLILAGTLGNLYDRLVFNGVRDFLHWNYLFDWPVFNIADCCLVCGAGLLLVQAFLYHPGAPARDKGDGTKPAEPSQPQALAS